MILSAIAIILLGYAYCETLMRADGFWDGALINSAKIFGLVIVLCGGFLCLSCRIWLPSLSYYLEGVRSPLVQRIFSWLGNRSFLDR